MSVFRMRITQRESRKSERALKSKYLERCGSDAQMYWERVRLHKSVVQDLNVVALSCSVEVGSVAYPTLQGHR